MRKLDSHQLSYILRHCPESVGVTLDKYGWCNVKELCSATHTSTDELESLVKSNTRFIYNADHTYVKAAHGHSVPVIYENAEVPPERLYHGTSRELEATLRKEGIKPMSRVEVHLSSSPLAAAKIGVRHSDDVWIAEVDAGAMHRDGIVFYRSEDNVWLVSYVDPKYILN